MNSAFERVHVLDASKIIFPHPALHFVITTIITVISGINIA